MIKVLFQTQLNEIADTDVEGVGVLRYDENGNKFRFVQNGEASSVTATRYGLACYDGGTRTTVKKPTTAQLANSAGFWQAAVPGQKYGWIKVEGKGTGIVIRSGSASSITIASSAAFLSNYIGVNAQEYLTESNAIGFGSPIVCPSTLASLATTAVGTVTASLVFSCRL